MQLTIKLVVVLGGAEWLIAKSLIAEGLGGAVKLSPGQGMRLGAENGV